MNKFVVSASEILEKAFLTKFEKKMQSTEAVGRR